MIARARRRPPARRAGKLGVLLALAALAPASVFAQGTPDHRPGTPPRLTVPQPSSTPAPSPPPPPGRARAGAGNQPTREHDAALPAPVTGVPGEVQVTPERVRIGDRVRVMASYGAPGAWTAVPGDDLKAGGKLGPFRILASDGSHPGTLALDLGPDEVGALTIPAFPLVFRDAGGVTVTVAVPQARVMVASVIGEGDSTAIADLKPPAELPVPWPWATLAMLAAAVLLAAAATWWLARYLRRERAPRPQGEIALPPGMTPEAWAREELAKIVAAGLLEPGRHREAHIAIADLVRRYLELRFRLPAMERTTEEIGDEMPRALIDASIVRLTIGALSSCDRVKFAKHVPPREELDATLAEVREMLERGAPPAVSEPVSEGPPAAAPPAAIDAAGTAA